MIIKDAATAHEYAQSWISESSPSRASWYINRCADSMRSIASSLRAIGCPATDNEAAESVLREYVRDLSKVTP